MTREEAEEIVRRWQNRLGLDMWELHVVWPEDYGKWPETTEKWPTFNAHDYASIWRAKDYDNARLYLSPDKVEASEGDRDFQATIVHELLHLVTRDIEQIIEKLDGLLAPQVHDLITHDHDHAMEGAIDRLSYRIVDLVMRGS